MRAISGQMVLTDSQTRTIHVVNGGTLILTPNVPYTPVILRPIGSTCNNT
jgi:hypothetical protein